MYTRILVAIDDSATSRRALEEAVNLARDQRAALRIVCVVDRIALLGAAQIADAAESLRQWQEIGNDALKRAQGVAAGAGVNADTALLETGDVEDRIAQAIIGAATGWHAELLVAGTHGRSGLDHLLMGSVAEGLVRHTPVPIMLVRKR
jgi:nucleotide-binding universal stress UspA family protein